MIVSAKLARGNTEHSALVSRLHAEGFDSGIELPFEADELSCWLMRESASSMNAKELVTALKVRVALRTETKLTFL